MTGDAGEVLVLGDGRAALPEEDGVGEAGPDTEALGDAVKDAVSLGDDDCELDGESLRDEVIVGEELTVVEGVVDSDADALDDLELDADVLPVSDKVIEVEELTLVERVVDSDTEALDDVLPVRLVELDPDVDIVDETDVVRDADSVVDRLHDDDDDNDGDAETVAHDSGGYADSKLLLNEAAEALARDATKVGTAPERQLLCNARVLFNGPGKPAHELLLEWCCC